MLMEGQTETSLFKRSEWHLYSINTCKRNLVGGGMAKISITVINSFFDIICYENYTVAWVWISLFFVF